MSKTRFLALGGLAVWLMVGAPVVVQGGIAKPLLAGWAVAYALFAILWLADLRWPRRSLLALEGACVIVVVLLLCDGYEGTLMVLIAMRLASSSTRRFGLTWIAVQSLLLSTAIAIHWNVRAAILLAVPYIGFQILGFLTFEVLEREARNAERLRISRELHDSLGHHLTALTLNLESALLRSSGEARVDVEKAQSLARTLLADVREIVSSTDSGGPVDLTAELQSIAGAIPRPLVHLDVESGLDVSDARSKHIVLRCAQEIVTNAARHSGAANLWISIERSGDRLQIRAHDDGRGSVALEDGFGLQTMRARFEAAGGELRIDTAQDCGFSLVAALPIRASA